MIFFVARLSGKETFITAIISMLCILSSICAFAAETIKVASIFAHSGVAAPGNLTAVEGVRFAVDEINRQGGLLGKKLEVIEYDNHSTALHSKKAAEAAVNDGVAVVFGANWSSHSQAMAPILQSAQIPMIAVFSTNPDVTRVGDYIFRVCFIDSFQGRIMANFAIQDLHAGKAAIMINSGGRYSEGLADYFKKYFTELGGKIVAEEYYLQDAEVFTPTLKKIFVQKPDVLFVPGHVIDSGLIIKQARELGYTFPILGGDGWGTSMYDIAGSALNGTYFSGHWHEKDTSGKSRDFVKGYTQFTETEVDGGTALAYDAVHLFANAVHQAGTFAPSKVRETLAATEHFTGVTGNLSFNEFGDPIKSGIITRFEEGAIIYMKTVMP